MHLSDEILISGIKTDDYSSFNQLFARYYSKLCAYVFGITNSHTASEEVIQELFIRLWIHRQNLDIKENISGYLYRSAKNATLNYLRAEQNRRKSTEKIPVPELSNDEFMVEQTEFGALLLQCIDQLPVRSKEVFLKSRFEGLKQKDIAKEQGTSVKTVKNQLWKSLQYLKKCLESKEAS